MWSLILKSYYKQYYRQYIVFKNKLQTVEESPSGFHIIYICIIPNVCNNTHPHQAHTGFGTGMIDQYEVIIDVVIVIWASGLDSESIGAMFECTNFMNVVFINWASNQDTMLMWQISVEREVDVD